MNKSTVRLLLVFIVVLVASALLVYFILGRSNVGRYVYIAGDGSATQQSSAQPPDAGASPRNGGESIISELFGSDTASPVAQDLDPGVVTVRIFLRFLMAAILSAFLAFRWRKGLALTRRNPYVAQTQILLAVVAAAMMMVVGDSAARAFGIFAAASLVRFRTNIRDPKETTVLLICLGVGLACGVGRLDMAAILTLFVLVALLILEYFESAQVFRAMEVTVETRSVDQTLQVLQNLFRRHGFTSELRQLNREAEGDLGKIVYEVNMGGTNSTDRLTEEILAEDQNNIGSLEWDQKKSTTYIYR